MMPRPGTGSAAGPTIVIALGGNALQPPGERGDIHQQFAHTRESLGPIVALARAGWRIAIVHGNGPQIGDELLRNDRAREERPPLPLGVLVAATAGWIGYMIQQSLRNALQRGDVARDVVTLITQVRVEVRAGQASPAKPVGHAMSEAEARRLADEFGWRVEPSDGGWRRVVDSPDPVEFMERDQVAELVRAGTIVVAAGGGGTPVRFLPDGTLDGVDAVIDKDRAAALLARDLHAAQLLILTRVEGAYRQFGTRSQTLLDRLTASEAEQMALAGEFGAGSMLPKIEAAVDFVRGGGEAAFIARLDQGLEAVHGEAGTTIVL
jgi:carbamate kinase